MKEIPCWIIPKQHFLNGFLSRNQSRLNASHFSHRRLSGIKVICFNPYILLRKSLVAPPVSKDMKPEKVAEDEVQAVDSPITFQALFYHYFQTKSKREEQKAVKREKKRDERAEQEEIDGSDFEDLGDMEEIEGDSEGWFCLNFITSTEELEDDELPPDFASVDNFAHLLEESGNRGNKHQIAWEKGGIRQKRSRPPSRSTQKPRKKRKK